MSNSGGEMDTDQEHCIDNIVQRLGGIDLGWRRKAEMRRKENEAQKREME